MIIAPQNNPRVVFFRFQTEPGIHCSEGIQGILVYIHIYECLYTGLLHTQFAKMLNKTFRVGNSLYSGPDLATRVAPRQARVAVSDASRHARMACRLRSTCRTDCDSILCTTPCCRQTCISAAKVTFGAVTAQRWAVAVSSLACRVPRHVRV